MIKTSIEKISRDIGFDIGNSDDRVQADLLNGFSDALTNMKDKHHIEMQMCYITDKLNKNSRFMIKELADMIKTVEQERE